MLRSLSIPSGHFPTPVSSFFKKLHFITSYGTRNLWIESLASPDYLHLFFLLWLWWIILYHWIYLGLFPRMGVLLSQRAHAFSGPSVPTTKFPSIQKIAPVDRPSRGAGRSVEVALLVCCFASPWRYFVGSSQRQQFLTVLVSSLFFFPAPLFPFLVFCQTASCERTA